MSMTPDTTAKALAGLLLGAGALHMLRPEPFDSIVPDWAPGTARQATIVSGAAELAVGSMLARPATRRAGGWATAALMAAVFPGNIEMARQWRHRDWPQRAIAYGRLPLQLPLILGGLRVARAG